MSSAFDIKPNNGLSIDVVDWWSPPPPCHVPFMKKNLHNKTQVCSIVVRICHSLASSCLPFTPHPHHPEISTSSATSTSRSDYCNHDHHHIQWTLCKGTIVGEQDRRIEGDGNYSGWINIYRQFPMQDISNIDNSWRSGYLLKLFLSIQTYMCRIYSITGH